MRTVLFKLNSTFEESHVSLYLICTYVEKNSPLFYFIILLYFNTSEGFVSVVCFTRCASRRRPCQHLVIKSFTPFSLYSELFDFSSSYNNTFFTSWRTRIFTFIIRYDGYARTLCSSRMSNTKRRHQKRHNE